MLFMFFAKLIYNNELSKFSDHVHKYLNNNGPNI